MSVTKCLLGKVGSGKLTARQMADIEERISKYQKENIRSMTPEQAEAMASKQAMEEMTREQAVKARQTKLSLTRQAELLKNKAQYNGNGQRWLLSEMDVDTWAQNKAPPVSNLQAIHRNRAFSMMNKVLEEFRPRLAGIKRPRAGVEDLVRELHGQNTGIATAKEMADGFRAASKYVWTEFNRFSGDAIPWREDWGMPHAHDAMKIAEVAPDKWIDDIIPSLNREKMLDFGSGKPMSDSELRLMLRDVYENIKSHGMGGSKGRGKAIGNRRSDPRILQFKDGDAWLEYHKQYGDGDPIHALTGYIESMSRDIGLMEKFGPNPRGVIDTMMNAIREEDLNSIPKNMREFAKKQWNRTLGYQVEGTYIQMTGGPGTVNKFFGGIMGTTRTALSGVLLQGSTLSAVTDLNGQRIVYRMVGLPQFKALTNIVRNYAGAAKSNQQLALHLGLGAESWIQAASGAARYTGDTVGPGWAQRMSDITMRAIGITPWTQGGKNVIGMDLYSLLHRESGKAFDGLSKELKHEFERFGITAKHWDTIRSAEPLTTRNGAKYVNPINVFNGGDDMAREAATRLQNFELTLQKTAMIETSPRVRAALLGDTKGGTLWGEVARNIALFKNFPLTMMHMQLFNAVQSRAGLHNKAAMMANIVIGGMVFGAIATQSKHFASGRDPASMDPTTPEGRAFWGSALTQGGGLSLFGDFLFADQNRFGKGLTASFMGPVWDLGDDITRFTYGNIQQAFSKEDMNVSGEALKLARKYMPFGKMWYWKLGFERKVLDQMDMYLDPKAHKRMQRQEQQYWKERKQKSWWKKGSASPERAPNLEAALGN